jgi:hypothetical protein
MTDKCILSGWLHECCPLLCGKDLDVAPQVRGPRLVPLLADAYELGQVVKDKVAGNLVDEFWYR